VKRQGIKESQCNAVEADSMAQALADYSERLRQFSQSMALERKRCVALEEDLAAQDAQSVAMQSKFQQELQMRETWIQFLHAQATKFQEALNAEKSRNAILTNQVNTLQAQKEYLISELERGSHNSKDTEFNHLPISPAEKRDAKGGS